MAEFVVHDRDSAPEAASAFDRAEEKWGMVPNLIGTLAEAPNAAEAYLELHDLFTAGTLDGIEQSVVLLSVARENRCHYCVAAHTGGAKQAGLDDASVEALRDGEALADERLEALRRFTVDVVQERGWVGEESVQDFLDAGFDRRQLLEVVLGVTLKTLSNYTNHIADTPLDEPFTPLAWEPEEAGATT